MIQTIELVKNFVGVIALNKASINVKPNSITAIIGPNGSGKTTLLNAISKLIPIEKGSIILKNNDITPHNDYEVAKHLSRTFQEIRLFDYLTVFDHLSIALSIDDEKFFKSLLNSSNNQTIKIKEILNQVGFNKPLSTYVTELSFGQKKLLNLAIAIAKPCSVLILDEPVAGVSQKIRKQIMQIIIDLKKSGKTIIIVEHDMNFVMDLVDDVFVINKGKIIFQGTPKQVQNNKNVLEVYLGA